MRYKCEPLITRAARPRMRTAHKVKRKETSFLNPFEWRVWAPLAGACAEHPLQYSNFIELCKSERLNKLLRDTNIDNIATAAIHRAGRASLAAMYCSSNVSFLQKYVVQSYNFARLDSHQNPTLSPPRRARGKHCRTVPWSMLHWNQFAAFQAPVYQSSSKLYSHNYVLRYLKSKISSLSFM